jgi:hypothetical protein
MLASILIILISFALLAYWFRYSCILLLRGQAESMWSQSPESQFNFGSARARLGDEPEMGALHVALQRDHQVITYLLEHAPGLELSSFEDKLLLWDYKAMQLWYRMTRIAAPDQARQALSEMGNVLAVIGGKIGARAGIQAEA